MSRENKDVIIGKESRERMSRGVDKLANAVKATLGPRGRNVAIETDYGPPIITKDGVTVAKYINLSDNIENMGAQLVKSVAASANTIAGDGTTTATVLSQSIYNRGVAAVETGMNPVLLKRGIDFGLSHVLRFLDESSVPITDEESVVRVATISTNNDLELGTLIAEAICAVGKDGLVSVEEAAGQKTTIQYAEGLRLDRGMLSHEFINNPTKLNAELHEPYILCYSDKIHNIQEIFDLINNEFVGKPNQLLIIAKDIDIKPLQILIANQMKGLINCCVIKAPGFGDTMKAMLEDVAILTGGTLINNDDGIGVKKATMKDLGRARKVIVGLNTTTIIDGSADKASVEERVAAIKEQLKTPDGLYSHQIETLTSRLARLNGAVAIIRVGGPSESEMEERKDRVEDAVNAVFSALSDGVVSGGGSQLLRASKMLKSVDTSSLRKEEVAGVQVLRDAIQDPFKQILINSGFSNDEIEEVISKILESGEHSGYDAFNLKHSDNMLLSGIIDPTKVVKTALEKAASASGTLLTTEVSISLEPIKG